MGFLLCEIVFESMVALRSLLLICVSGHFVLTSGSCLMCRFPKDQLGMPVDCLQVTSDSVRVEVLPKGFGNAEHHPPTEVWFTLQPDALSHCSVLNIVSRWDGPQTDHVKVN